MQSQGFRPEIFEEPSEYEETPLRDRKSKLYNLRRDDEKAEFIRDVISLANTGRLWEKPAYLIFGLTNDGYLCGIQDDLKIYESSAHWPLDSNQLTLVMEKIRLQISGILAEYIAPQLLKWEWKWGQIETVLGAYLLIWPVCPEQAFHVSRDLRSGRRTLLRAEQCWIRSGESRREVKRREHDLDAPGYAHVPFLPPSKWIQYFEHLCGNRETLKARAISSYIDLHTDSGLPLREEVEKFLDASDQQVMIIEGLPGSGKTTFLRRLTADWADAGITAMQEMRRREEFGQPPGWIPVYFPLRHLQGRLDCQTFARGILRKVNSTFPPEEPLWEVEPSSPERLLENNELRWLLCLDGLDELERYIDQFLATIRSFQLRYPRPKILITARPVTTIPNDFEFVKIAPLSREAITNYLQSYWSEEADPVYQQLKSGLLDHQSELYQLHELCATPLYLEAVAEMVSNQPLPTKDLDIGADFPSGGEQDADTLSPDITETQPPGVSQPVTIEPLQAPISAEPESKSAEEEQPTEETSPQLTLGWILDRTITRVWEREAKRSPIRKEKLDQWWRATGALSLQMDGHRLCADHDEVKKKYKTREGMQWVLNLAILETSRQGIRFTNHLFQNYFGAAYLRDSPDAARWQRKCTENFWRDVQRILHQITY